MANCRECSLPIRPFKQVVQIDPEVCEECHIIVLGLSEFPDKKEKARVPKRSKGTDCKSVRC